MKRVLGVLLGLCLGAVAQLAQAGEPTPAQPANPNFSHGNWNVACDGQGGCSTWGLGETWASAGYIVLITGADGRRAIGLGTYDTNSARPWHAPLVFTLDVVDSQGRTIWSRAFPGRDESRVWLKARMTDAAEVDRALQALAVGDQARLRVDGQAEPAAVISLKGSAAALLWARAHGQADPARPVIRRAPPVSQTRLPRSRPSWELSEDETACPAGRLKVETARLGPGKVLWISTCEIGYNNNAVLRLSDDRGRLLETPAIETSPNLEVGQNLTYDPASRTLASTVYGNSTWTCGDAANWVWDGARFRLASQARMDDCQGMGKADWPVIYRARIVDH